MPIRKHLKLDLGAVEAHLSKKRTKGAATGEAPVDPRLEINGSAFSPAAYLRSGSDLNTVSDSGFSTPLERAIDDGDWKTVRAMLAAGARPRNERPMQPPGALGYVSGVTPEIMRLLVQHGVDVNGPNSIGYCALMSAVSSMRPDMVKTLLDLGADVHARDFKGYTALHEWAEDGAPDWKIVSERRAVVPTLKILLSAGADIEARDGDGLTPLQVCLDRFLWSFCTQSNPTGWDYGGHAYCAKLLLKAGARADAPLIKSSAARWKGVQDKSPMLMARPYGDGSLHMALLRAGASPIAKSGRGATPLSAAEGVLKELAKPPTPVVSYRDDPKVVERVLAAMRKQAARSN